jgi:hypothetical protein
MEGACVYAERMGPVGTEDAFVLLLGTILLGCMMLLMGLFISKLQINSDIGSAT